MPYSIHRNTVYRVVGKPKPGDTADVFGRTYTFLGEKPGVTSSGRRFSALIFRGTCTVCGEDFTFDAARSRFVGYATCPKHRGKAERTRPRRKLTDNDDAKPPGVPQLSHPRARLPSLYGQRVVDRWGGTGIVDRRANSEGYVRVAYDDKEGGYNWVRPDDLTPIEKGSGPCQPDTAHVA